MNILDILILGFVLGAVALVGTTITHELGVPMRRVAHRVDAIALMDGAGHRDARHDLV